MMMLTTLSGKQVLVNPSHIILIEESSNTFGESSVEIYHSASKAPLTVRETFEEVQMLLHQINK